MLSNLITCLNVVMPLMLVVALGYILHDRGFINDSFVRDGVKLTFSIGFPCSLINSFSTMDLAAVMNVKLVVLVVSAVILSAVIPMIVLPLFVKDRRIAASMAQSMFRTNVMVQGYSLLVNVYGEGNIAQGEVLLPFIMIANNLMAPLIFIFMIPDNGGKKLGLPGLIKKILSNPLFFGSVIGVLLSVCHITLPTLVQSALSQVGKLATPLSLICMGAELRFDTIRSGLKYTLPSALVRLVVVPTIVTLMGIALGFRGIELGSIFLMFSTASATACFVMAASMGGDTDIAAQSICLSVLLSAFTVTAGLFVLLQLNLI